MIIEPQFHGQQLKAARVLAGQTLAQLAGAAGVTIRTIHQLEIGGSIHVAPKRRHGHVSAEVWARITEALNASGVELLAATDKHGAGVRWREPQRQAMG